MQILNFTPSGPGSIENDAFLANHSPKEDRQRKAFEKKDRCRKEAERNRKIARGGLRRKNIDGEAGETELLRLNLMVMIYARAPYGLKALNEINRFARVILHTTPYA